ncbi:sugar ABC transporter permease [Terrilactibacillus laevilacticus]|uniref:Sugar ABC transporter permease n=1 Tax=Terrilactibacillus laevilacticus TaxID=1380157 RepID=A0ABW5PUP0_9BACI|nr:sugar ABC transporter permease [Terrilactibacillus laevilacticus]
MKHFIINQKINKFFNRFFTYLFLIVLSVIILYPLLITVQSAFNVSNLAAFALDTHMKWTLDNFHQLFTQSLYLTWFKNTMLIVILTMVIQVIIVTLAGYTYSRYRFKGRKNGLIFFLIIQMVPTMAALTAFFVLGLIINGLDQYWYLTMVYVGGGIPMNTWLMKGYFDTIPRDLDESARIDGAGHLRILCQINLPLAMPMIAVQALWAFMGPFGDYLLAAFLLRSPENMTVAVGLQQFIANPTNQNVSMFAAGSFLISIPIVILFLFLQRYFKSGLTAGGTKG